ncbi:MAG: hypothetical protein V4489_00435 [Chlamydiota bacterium]
MNSLPLVISFYTLDTPYEEEVKYLQASCEAFKIEHKIEGVPSSGSWEMNCAFKPIFILKKMEECQRPLLWVDADAVFVRPLELLSCFSADLGVRIYPCPDDHPSKIVSATIFINYTEAAKNVIRLWAEECLLMLNDKERTQEMWDQDALRRVLFTKAHKAQFSPLPVEYSKIVGHLGDEEECREPVIIQNQASRRYKRWINHPEERLFGW